MNYDLTIDKHNLGKFVSYYHPFLETTSDPRILYSFKSPEFKIIVYNSHKVLFQGKQAYEEYALWADHFGQDKVSPIDSTAYVNEYYANAVIGSDEVGTGDFFGPVVVCAAYVNPADYETLDELGVRDSKALSDKQIIAMGNELIQNVSYHVLVLSPEKFNELTNKGYNMNKIKAYLHNHAIKKMVQKTKKFDYVILDEFCSKENYFEYLKDEDAYKQIRFHTKAEGIHKAVAVASIIARYKFVLEMDRISKQIGIVLPKGSGPTADAIGKLIYLQHGIDFFQTIAKVSFKNMKRITGETE
ncbi:MAG: ribonuclease HIII [Bacilli bacterium]|nr:ribonuclease HIII [Bacilli bacterium]MBN2877492.1 ribonuclease HIII [Bacilli bacterium]